MKLEQIKELGLEGGELVEVRLYHEKDTFRTQPLYYGHVVEADLGKPTETFPKTPYVTFFEYKDMVSCLTGIKRIPIDQITDIQRPDVRGKAI